MRRIILFVFFLSVFFFLVETTAFAQKTVYARGTINCSSADYIVSKFRNNRVWTVGKVLSYGDLLARRFDVTSVDRQGIYYHHGKTFELDYYSRDQESFMRQMNSTGGVDTALGKERKVYEIAFHKERVTVYFTCTSGCSYKWGVHFKFDWCNASEGEIDYMLRWVFAFGEDEMWRIMSERQR